VYSTASGGQGGRTSDMRRDEQDKSCAARVQCRPGFVAQICVCVCGCRVVDKTTIGAVD
jgi:hypothetical protein